MTLPHSILEKRHHHFVSFDRFCVFSHCTQASTSILLMTTLDRKTNPDPLTRSQVENLTAAQVHQVLGRTMLVDGFDIVGFFLLQGTFGGWPNFQVYDLKKSKGAYLYDSRTKTNFLDMFSFFASWPVSHNHPKLHEPHYLKTVLFWHPSSSGANFYSSNFSLLLLLESTLLTPTFTRSRWRNSLRPSNALRCQRSLYIFSSSKVVLLPLRMGTIVYHLHWIDLIEFFGYKSEDSFRLEGSKESCCWSWWTWLSGGSLQGSVPRPQRLHHVAHQYRRPSQIPVKYINIYI